MTRPRLIIPLVLAILVLSSAGAATAQKRPPNAKGPKARITWSVERVDQNVSPGQVVQLDVTVTSSADLTNVTLRAPGGLGRVLEIAPTTITTLKAGVAAPVRLTIELPAEGAHSQGGVVQLRAGKRLVPSVLSVKLTVPGSEDDASPGD